MADSPEHQYLSAEFLNIIERFSALELYGLREPERRRYDFSCTLLRDWARPLVGQTLWSHTEGVDKDIRTLLTADDAHIVAYVCRDTVKNRALVDEVVRDFRRTRYAADLYKLRVLWIPHDFDADDENARRIVAAHLQDAVVGDVLFHVVFGNLTADDVRLFVGQTGQPGLHLAVLYEVATRGFLNYPDLSRRTDSSAGPLRERILALLGTGFIWQRGRGSMYYVSLKGRVFLEVLRRLLAEAPVGALSDELRFVLDKLELCPAELTVADLLAEARWTPEVAFGLLWHHITAALARWDVDLTRLEYRYGEGEDDRTVRTLR